MRMGVVVPWGVEDPLAEFKRKAGLETHQAGVGGPCDVGRILDLARDVDRHRFAAEIVEGPSLNLVFDLVVPLHWKAAIQPLIRTD